MEKKPPIARSPAGVCRRSALPAIALATLCLAACLALSAAHAGDAASTDYELGAVLDVRQAGNDGVRVLAVTPGGTADRIGLRAGDQLHAINGQSLARAGNPRATLAQALQDSGGRLRLDLSRDGTPLQLSGSADARPVASMGGGCGYVTETTPTPRVSEDIHQAEITQINGRSTPLWTVNRHQLDAGRHVLVVAERIKPHRLSNVQNHQISLMKRREQARAYKALVVDIEPDTVYSIGARLHRDRLDNASIRDNAYWEPVIWQERAARCR